MSKMIQCPTQTERYADISKRSGFPVDVVKRILTSEAESTLDNLKEGKRVVLYGVCSLTPTVKKRVGLLGSTERIAVVECKPSPILADTLNKLDKFEIQQEDTLAGVRVQSLACLE